MNYSDLIASRGNMGKIVYKKLKSVSTFPLLVKKVQNNEVELRKQQPLSNITSFFTILAKIEPYKEPLLMIYACELYLRMKNLVFVDLSIVHNEYLIILTAIRLAFKLVACQESTIQFVNSLQSEQSSENIRHINNIEKAYCQSVSFEMMPSTPVPSLLEALQNLKESKEICGDCKCFEKNCVNFKNFSLTAIKIMSTTVLSEDYWYMGFNKISACSISIAMKVNREPACLQMKQKLATLGSCPMEALDLKTEVFTPLKKLKSDEEDKKAIDFY